MVLRISAYSSRELRAVILFFRQTDRELKRLIRRETKAMIDPVWREAVNANVRTRLESRVLGQTARVQVSDRNVTLRSAHIGRPLSGTLRPSEEYHVVEFGADREVRRTYEARSRKGTRYTVHDRRINRHLRRANRKGYVVYPAAAEAIPRLARLWVQTVVRFIHEGFEAR